MCNTRYMFALSTYNSNNQNSCQLHSVPHFKDAFNTFCIGYIGIRQYMKKATGSLTGIDRKPRAYQSNIYTIWIR